MRRLLVGRKKEATRKKTLTHNVVCVSHLIYCTHCNLNRLDKLFDRVGYEGKRTGENDTVIHLCLCQRVKNQKTCKENFSPQGLSNHSSNKVNNCFSQMLTLVLLQAKVAFLWQMVLWQCLAGRRGAWDFCWWGTMFPTLLCNYLWNFY